MNKQKNKTVRLARSKLSRQIDNLGVIIKDMEQKEKENEKIELLKKQKELLRKNETRQMGRLKFQVCVVSFSSTQRIVK